MSTSERDELQSLRHAVQSGFGSLDCVVAGMSHAEAIGAVAKHIKSDDFYRDTHARMRHDNPFRSSVDMLVAHAKAHGFTPGELKQIAFAAAVEAFEAKPYWRPIGECGELPDGRYVILCISGYSRIRGRWSGEWDLDVTITHIEYLGPNPVTVPAAPEVES